jgi:alanyl-tRNA synthetase
VLMGKEEAIQSGACAVFGEKYAELVRVVKIGEHSSELCGGSHVGRTGDIGLIKIVGETALAAGVRRIEALAGASALSHTAATEEILKAAAALLKAAPTELAGRLAKLLQSQRDLEKAIEALKSKLALQDSGDLGKQIKEVRGVRLLAAEVKAPDIKTLRELGDRMRVHVRSGIVFLASKMPEGKVMLLCLVTKDLTERYNAGDIIKQIAPLVGGSGGGKAEMAQAGGSEHQNIPLALKKVEELL